MNVCFFVGGHFPRHDGFPVGEGQLANDAFDGRLARQRRTRGSRQTTCPQADALAVDLRARLHPPAHRQDILNLQRRYQPPAFTLAGAEAAIVKRHRRKTGVDEGLGKAGSNSS